MVTIARTLPLLAALVAGSGPAAAAEPDERIVYRNLSMFRLNPLGLIDIGEVNYRHRLYGSDSVALKDNFFGVGLAPAVSPAFARLGIVAELQPASFLRLWGSYEFVRYFGMFNFLQSFPSATSDFSDTTLERLGALPDEDPARSYATSGRQLNLGATLQFKLGPVALRNLSRFMYADFDLREGDRVFYDILFDILAPDRGWYLNNDTELLYVTDFGLTAGVRYTVGHAWYGPEHFAPGEDTSANPNYPFHRLGPMVAYSFWKDRGGAFDNPTVLAVVNWWAQHRYRTGADVTQAFPLVLIGFSFTGDLTPAGW
jgi:hypothetical protein